MTAVLCDLYLRLGGTLIIRKLTPPTSLSIKLRYQERSDYKSQFLKGMYATGMSNKEAKMGQGDLYVQLFMYDARGNS